MIDQLSPTHFAAWCDAAAPMQPIVLDVREPWELQTASVKPGGFALLHMPMQSIPARMAELREYGTDQPIACLCHHGIRSLQVANYLVQNGFSAVVNVQGGIDAWAQHDSSIAQY